MAAPSYSPLGRDELSDRIRGCLFGQAVGDALGLGTEFMTKADVKENYPGGLIRAGLAFRWRHCQAWEREQQSKASEWFWDPGASVREWGPFKIKSLLTDWDLLDEGLVMRH